jgi:hypothetical protein
MHPQLVASVREWTVGLEPDEPLFPRLARKKTYTMVQKDLERAGIPYETHEGLADFHAAGRHSHITGLIASGASIMEAKELARHADIRQTAKHIHIGMNAKAGALAGLVSPEACESVELSEICRDSGGALGQEVSPGVSDDTRHDGPENEKTPSRGGVSSQDDTASQRVSADVSSGGGGNCTRSSLDAYACHKYVLSKLSGWSVGGMLSPEVWIAGDLALSVVRLVLAAPIVRRS